MSADAALLAFALCLLAGHRSEPQMLLGHLAGHLGRAPALLALAIISTLATSAVAALLGAWLSAMVAGFERAALAGAALILAGVLAAKGRAYALPAEPTRSHGAIAFALIGKQLVDAPRLIIFASAAMLATPWHALAGGGLAASLTMSLGWLYAERIQCVLRWPWLRIVTALCLILIGALIVWMGYVSR